MQLQDLQIYTKLYEQRSINRVARLMGFAQSNVTARLKVLEDEFGVQLFTRSYQGITPTTSGEQFYQYAQTVLRATAAVRKQMHPAPRKRQIIMSTLLFNLLVVQQGKFTLATNSFALKSSTEIVNLSDSKADLVVTYANFHNAGYRETESARLKAAFLTNGKPAPGAPYLVNSDKHCPFRARTLRFLHDMTQVKEIDSWDSIIGLVKAGRGIALLPDYLVVSDDLHRQVPSHQFRVPYATFVRIG